MLSNDQLLEKIEHYIANIELPSEPERLYAPISYSLEGGGKRIRPMLVLLAYQLYGSQMELALPAAAAVEIFHNFTLLHDDIMDNALLRRSKPSVHAAWGQNVAILSGDVMMILAYTHLAKIPAVSLPQVLEVFNNMSIEVCEGQQYDMDFEERERVTVEEYMRMIELKTSVLLGGSATIGAILGGACDRDRAIIAKLATELGLAFQLQDDLLDSYGDSALGKKIGGDILEGKQTYLMITAINRATAEQIKALRSTHTDESLSDEEKIARIKSIYELLEVAKITEQQIAAHFDRALTMLAELNIDAERVAPLRAFAEGLINRVK